METYRNNKNLQKSKKYFKKKVLLIIILILGSILIFSSFKIDELINTEETISPKEANNLLNNPFNQMTLNFENEEKEYKVKGRIKKIEYTEINNYFDSYNLSGSDPIFHKFIIDRFEENNSNDTSQRIENNTILPIEGNGTIIFLENDFMVPIIYYYDGDLTASFKEGDEIQITIGSTGELVIAGNNCFVKKVEHLSHTYQYTFFISGWCLIIIGLVSLSYIISKQKK